VSFGSTKNLPVEKPKMLGVRSEQAATNEGARVVPYFCGTRWLGVTWLGDQFNVKTTPVSKKIGKKSSVVGYDYYASFCGLVSLGTCDLLTEVHFDDEKVWSGSLVRGSEDSTSITIEGRGVLYIQWGTETQTLHSVLAASGIDHAAYRGQTVIIGDQILWGQDRTTAPNVKIRIGRFPRPSWLTAAVARVGNDVNPIAALWDFWTHPRAGVKRSESLLDITRLAATAATLKTEGIGISPLLTSEEDFKGLQIRILECIDGYPTSYDGKMGVELIRTPGSYPAINFSDIEGDVSISSQLWPDTSSDTRVRFVDDELKGSDNSARYQDIANLAITGNRKINSVDRAWVTNHGVASNIANAVGKVAAVPQITGGVRLRQSKATAINVGSAFSFLTRDSKTLYLRCTKRTDEVSDKRLVSIDFESDRSWANGATYTPTATTIPSTPSLSPAAPTADALDAPYALSVNGADTLIYAVARADSHSTAFDVHRSYSPTGNYGFAAQHRNGALFENFSTKAVLTASYSASTPLLDQYTGIAFQLTAGDSDLLAQEYSESDAYEHELLAFFSNEIMSLYSIQKTGSTTYTAKVLRGLYDTRRKAHSSGDVVWVCLRSRLATDAWPPPLTTPFYYKFQTSFLLREVDLSSLPVITHTSSQRALLPLPPANLRANGDGAHPYWTTGNDVTLTWDNSARARTGIGLALNDYFPTDLTHVLIQIRSYDGATLLDSVVVSAEGGSTVLSNSYLVSTVGADFSVRAYGVRNGLLSTEYDTIQVDKV
jgi:hypothetical protein